MMFDYEIMFYCEYEILDSHNNPFDCAEPAPYHVWWEDPKKDGMTVCKEHFNFIKECEEK